MSYLNYPRIHFSGLFQASPSTINNTPNNYNPVFYPSPNELQNVELYWNPKGNGGFSFIGCKITQVDYADGTSATSAEQDSIIGQPVKAVQKAGWPLQAALVDLDPMQQNTSEIWALTLQIGGDEDNLTGSFSPASFNSIWQQCQGADAPRSSASGSAAFQALMKPVTLAGNATNSRFLQYFKTSKATTLSVNFNTNGHNNAPPIYRFNPTTFTTMAGNGVPQPVLDKIVPMQQLIQMGPSVKGDIPTSDFVKYMLQQYLTVDEFNASIDTILKDTATPYTPYGPYDFLQGMITGTVGPATEADPVFFVPSRILCPPDPNSTIGFFAPFIIDSENNITLNLGNSLPTSIPGSVVNTKKLGKIWLVAFPDGNMELANAKQLVEINYQGADFITTGAGFFTTKLNTDYSETPLGIKSILDDGTESVLLQENEKGYCCRADQFVFRMNPGEKTTPEFPRGDTATVHIHALKFGKPVPDGTKILMTMMNEEDAINYTSKTPGTSGSAGIKDLSIPQNALVFTGESSTKNGVAIFNLACTDPKNPRGYVDGQIYFLEYDFDLQENGKPVIVTQDPNDIVSVQVYNQLTEEEASDVLAKFGRIYKIMGFLTDKEKVEQIDLRNMIKTLLSKPFSDLVHMPVTRDLSASAQKKIVGWIDALNNS